MAGVFNLRRSASLGRFPRSRAKTSVGRMRRFDLVTGTAYGLLRTLLRPCSLRSARPLQAGAEGSA